MTDLRIIEAILEIIYPYVSFAAWCIVIYQNIRYKKEIKELQKLKSELIAALNLLNQERT